MHRTIQAPAFRSASFLLAGTVLLTSLAACAPARTTEAFCAVMDEHEQAYLEQMAAASAQGTGGIFQAVSALGDLKLMWKELAEVAPDDIRADAEAVSEAWQKQEDNAGAGDWMRSLTTAALNSGSMSRVDAYVRQNCDGGYSAAVPVETDEVAPSAPSTSTPEPAPVLLSDEWANNVGYTYAFELNTAVGMATKDVANAAPGSANITYQYSFTGTIANTTPERNAPAPDYVRVQPIWAADSPVCSIGGMAIGRGFSSNTPGREDAWCTFASMPYTLRAASNEIAVGATAQMQSSGGGVMPLVVPEDQADSIIAAIATPTAWVLGRNTGDGRLLDCLMDSGSYYASRATVETGCTAE